MHSEIIIQQRLKEKKRRLTQSKKVLIDSSLDPLDAYKQGHEQGISDALNLIERYAEIVLKDELAALQKKIYDEAKLEAQSVYNDEKSKILMAHAAAQQKMQNNHNKELELLKNSHKIVDQQIGKKSFKKGLSVGVVAGGFLASALIYSPRYNQF